MNIFNGWGLAEPRPLGYLPPPYRRPSIRYNPFLFHHGIEYAEINLLFLHIHQLHTGAMHLAEIPPLCNHPQHWLDIRYNRSG